MADMEFTVRQVVGITGLTQRQLGYWLKIGLINPVRYTEGGHARYSFNNLVALKAAKKLIDAGLSLQRIRKSLDSLIRLLPGLQVPLAEVSLVVTGDVVLVFHEGNAFEAVTGQEWVLPVAELAREAAHWDKNNKVQIPEQGDLFDEFVEGRRDLHIERR